MYRQSILFRLQYLLGGACLLCLLLYLFAYRPLAHRVVQLDQPLVESWDNLLRMNLTNSLRLGMDLDKVSENLLFAQKSVQAFQRAGFNVRRRLEWDADTNDKLQQPFQLLDFDQRRLQLIDELKRQAGPHKVTLEPAVLAGFPEYTFGREKPSLLWAQLAFVNRLVACAVTNDVATVKSLSLLPTKSYPPLDNSTVSLEEFSARVELAGSMESVFKFFLRLPGVTDLATPRTNAAAFQPPALFLDRLILRGSPTAPNEVTVETVLSGFLFHEPLP